MPELADVPGLPELWALTTGDPRVRVAVVDGGPIDMSHPCFDGATILEVDTGWLGDREADVEAELLEYAQEHGTWVASILFGRHGSTAPGLAPGCTGLIVPCLIAERHHVDPVNTARAIEAAVGAGAHIIVIEQCLPSRSDDVDGLLRAAVRHAEEQGVLVIAAAGNEKGECSCYPAALPEVLAVGAHDDDGAVYGFSNWGPQYHPTALVAPGGEMPGASLIDESGVKRHKGTSCSTPFAAGVAALLVSLQIADGGAIDPLAVRQALLDSAAPCSTDETDDEPARCLGGKLDIAGATEIIRSRSRTTTGDAGVVTSAVLPRRTGPVYALGTLGYDFGTEARRDTFKQLMAPVTIDGTTVPANPYDSRQMVDHLTAHPSETGSLIWTLYLELTPVYALEPAGPFAAEVHAALTTLFGRQILAPDDPASLERISVPGRLTDRTVRLFSGQVVPVVEVEQTRGVYGWRLRTLLDAAVAALGDQAGAAPATEVREALREFLARVYYDLRNRGSAAKDRALNFAATNVFQAATTVAEAIATGRALDTITVEKSPFCRLNSDCWDVKLRFFDPVNGLRSRTVFRFTIDVSDTLPVSLGPVHTWAESR
ncbi:serine peptidase [Streptomyces sp. NBRC 110611]|uniref:PatA/PatG family cyanobactin maturation protease n=1 Tax=Streptomyces sp. NBRC 110611 TaxID=1621259 RepID=UPI0008301AF7|nr:PatA/PatG family cyanobactin maturation protease [Streptomyces sp. NBRC 110611]GAU64771.1 serine peptidase [Streptomyces sp. NBRC 110611]